MERGNKMKSLARVMCLQSICALLAILFLLNLPLAAQDATGRIVGVVTDPAGSVVPKAKVTVTSVGTGVSSDTLAGEDGAYQVLLLPIGSYRVSAEAPGFRKTVTNPEKLDINQSLKIDLKLEIGATTESVQVEANATAVETVTAALGASVTTAAIRDLPLNGRNVMDLATLMPGVIPGVAGPTPADGSGFSIAGARTDSITFLLDGALNNNLLNNGLVLNPNPDAIEEFRVLTSNYGPEYGRNAGGIISVVTRSGGNQFHGSVSDYLRNGDLNANSFFNNENGLLRDTLKRNQFGAVLSGPVMLPKVFNHQPHRLFFMSAYQGQRQAQLQSSGKVVTFTPSELTGDFSHSNAAQNGPDPLVTSFLQQFPFFQPNAALAAQGIIDPSKINPVSQNYIKANLIPTAASGNLFSQSAARADADEITEKLDIVASDKDRISLTLGAKRGTTVSPYAFANVNGYASNTLNHRYFGSLNYTRTFSANLVNELRFSAQRNNNFQAVPGGKLPTPNQLGVGINSDDPSGPTILGFTDLTAGFSPQGPTELIDNTYTWSDALTWVRGHHALKAGFSYEPYQNNTAYDFYVNGEFFFYGTGGGSFSQNDRADFLMGLPDEYLQFPRAPSNIRSHNVAGFFQDEWKVRKNLTLTLGVRYEYSSPKLDLQGRSFSAILGQQSTVFPNAPLGLVFPGDKNAPVGSNFPDKNDWAPRFGFAWDPKGDGKMSIRGGVGVFYDILKGEDNLQFNGQAPFFGVADLFFDPLSDNPTAPSNSMSQPFVATGQPNPFPSKPPNKNLDFLAAGYTPQFGAGGVFFVDPHLRTPYVYQYNVSIQRELVRNLALEVSYIGSSSHKLTSLTQGNPDILGTKTRLFNTQPGVPANTFSYLDTFRNVGSANYNSLATGLSKRLSDVRILGNLSFQLSYTYGHSIDNVSGFRSRNSEVPYYNSDQFKGSSDFDLTHFVALSGSWEVPFAKAWSSGPRRLTKGWTLQPILTYRSGATLDVFAGLNRRIGSPGPSGAGDADLVRANLASPITFFNPGTYQTASNGSAGNFYFDPAAFERASLVALYNNNAAVTDPALRTYGSLGRNSFRGPTRANANVSLRKETFLHAERVRMDIQADFFNLPNNVQFNNPSTNITGGTFGQVSGTGDPRIIQLAARFAF
jgi:outer membrane receptor protein involved in Fe transport